MTLTLPLKHIEKSETLLINELSKQQESSGKTIYKFGFGQSPFNPPQFLIEALQNNAHRHEYMPVQGIKELRDAVIRFHQADLGGSRSADAVLVAPGSKILIFSVLAALDRANVILLNPSWVSYAPQAKLLGHAIHWVQTSFENKWKITPDALEAVGQTLDKNNPAIMILNYPCNPTGLTYSEAELKAIATVARKHNILVLSDEIYGLVTFNNTHRSLAQYYPEGTIVTTGLSKWCAAGGWRLGVAILPENLLGDFKETVLGIASETYSTATAPVQLAAVEAYSNPNMQLFIEQERQILGRIGRWSAKQLQSVGVNVHAPEGGFYIYPDFSNKAEALAKKNIRTGQDMCAKILEEAQVALLPGMAFGDAVENLRARLCFVDFDGDSAIEALKNPVESDDAFVKQFPKIEAGITALCEWVRGS